MFSYIKKLFTDRPTHRSRYYHYISDSKVDMMLPQIPKKFLSGIEVELGFDLGVVKGHLAGAATDLESRVKKLEIVESYLNENGSITRDVLLNGWLRGRIAARMGGFSECPGLLLISGEYEGRVLLLVGSEANLVSGVSETKNESGWSFAPRLFQRLESYLERNYDLADIKTEGKILPSKNVEDLLFGGQGGSAREMKRLLYGLAKSELPEQTYELEFLARIFYDDQDNRKPLVIGSPLFVADA